MLVSQTGVYFFFLSMNDISSVCGIIELSLADLVETHG